MYIDPLCQATPEWKAANKSGDLLLEIRWLAALNRHLARWWGHPNPRLAPGPANSHRLGNLIRLEQGPNRGPADEYLDAVEAEIDQDGGPFQGPPQGWTRCQRDSLLFRQSDLEVLIYYWISKRHPQLSNLGDCGNLIFLHWQKTVDLQFQSFLCRFLPIKERTLHIVVRLFFMF